MCVVLTYYLTSRLERGGVEKDCLPEWIQTWILRWDWDESKRPDIFTAFNCPQVISFLPIALKQF